MVTLFEKHLFILEHYHLNLNFFYFFAILVLKILEMDIYFCPSGENEIKNWKIRKFLRNL
jgi:hypothetical protein